MKIDCNITENYLKEKARMIESCKKADCSGCVFYNNRPCPTEFFQCDGDIPNPDGAIKFVQQWSDAHPQKTYKEDFFLRFPNALKNKNGYPQVSPCNIYKECCDNICDNYSCANCWDKVMEE